MYDFLFGAETQARLIHSQVFFDLVITLNNEKSFSPGHT